jgi:chaperonin GroEL
MLAIEYVSMGKPFDFKPVGIRQILDQITADCDYAIAELNKMVVPVSGNMIDHVSTISCNNNPVLGKHIADAIRVSGPHGVVSVEDSNSVETEVIREEGMQFTSGYRSNGFVTRADNQSVEFDSPVIFMLDRKLTSLQGLEPMISGVIKTGRPLLVLASDTDGEALAQLLILKQQGKLQVCCVSLPNNLGSHGEVLKDVAAIVGGNPMLKELQQNASDVKSDDLGSARRVVITKNSIRILGGAANNDRKKDRIEQIHGLLKSAPSQLDMERLQERLAKLTGGVTILKLGSQTMLEGADIKLRVDDAICAIKCAIDGGVVPGGGTALLRIAQGCHYKEVFEAPFRRILTNAGYDPDPIKEKLLRNDPSPWFGFNALTGQYVDLKEAGILDPLKVVREALLNAASVARQSLLTNTVISLVQEKR